MKVEKKFDPEIKKIESEIIENLLNFTIFSIRGEITSTILFYFITRKNLTQSELQNLTGFSAGKISQELNDFLEFNLIKISKKSKPWVYSMESVPVETLSRAISLLKTNLKWEPKFLEIKKELEDNREELEKLNGYDEVTDFLKVNLNRFTGFKKIVQLWEDLKKKYEKESQLGD
jgi:DNA-binding transcriptional regulator GbsR (MarR family)